MHMTVFRSRKRPGLNVEAYQSDAARMVELARAQPGFLSYKTFMAEDGETVTISEWANEADAKAWGSHFEHRAVQNRGRSEYYNTFTVYSCDRPGVRGFTFEGS
ncbi:antibiotic biosynthesis monooxygenase family protein [Novosphingobium beihaiensis]|uniref:Antibiotic biosynthesis monooxygenase n=1 Tax=Novosphingobium beihaiensis TaxID=2930389 RepID=A0ABT0BPF7_9SPHN|nr:antibiotic biosynthesis monooxygenase [Novosphingobium beihaiensis]MCJ2186941.1 antibiotic biosynthesis monooxygenase [Novosphingobium beihaiensis]